MIFIKKGIISVIVNEGSNDYLIWKSPIEDFYNNSTLIVSESENAIFYNQGFFEKIYDAGRYQLDSGSFPISTSLIKKFTSGKSPFHCKLFFVNTIEKINIQWGTASPIQLRDPEYKFIISVRSNGAYSVKINNPKKFLLKLIGTNVEILKFSEVGVLFREYFGSKIREFLHETIMSEKISIFDIESNLSRLSNDIKSLLDEFVNEYGLTITNFIISEISIPENDPHYEMINNALAKKAMLDIQGKDFERILQADALLNFSKNEGIGGIPGSIAAGNIYGKLTDKSTNNEKIKCPNCQSIIDRTSKFCPECGTKIIDGDKNV